MPPQAPRQPTFPIEAIAEPVAPGMAIPNGFAFSHDDALAYYLAPEEVGGPQSFFALDVATGQLRLVAAPPEGGVSEENLSPEEELRRQRERNLAVGITAFALARQSTRAIIPTRGDIYAQDGPGAPPRRVFARGDGPPAQTPALSPDGETIAFACDGEVWAVPASGGVARQVTGGERVEGVTRGLADYVAQEELHRAEGFWWSPDSQSIAFAEVDERHVPLYRIVRQGADETGPAAEEAHRYPFAGAANARVRLGVAPAAGGAIRWMECDTGTDDYLARVFWWPDGTLGAEMLDRAQTRLDLLRFDPATGARQTVLVERNETWINVDDKHCAPLDGGGFVWMSERTGFSHVSLHDASGALVRQLTSGAWVVDAIEAVDEAAGVVYVTGNPGDPTERHLLAAPLAGGEPRRLTPEAGTHAVTIDHGCRRFIDTHSALDTPPRVLLRDLADGRVLSAIHVPADPRVADFRLEPPEIVTLANSDGTPLYGAVYRPPAEFGPGPFPTVVEVYGGPGPQMVTNSWELTAALRAQYLRQLGILVFRFDNRGSARRGLAFEGAIKRRMGTVEVDDQVDGVRWLAARGLADPRRVGVTGWSYGGFMTLMCLAKAPGTFRVGVAGAPVTAWDGYDTCYTERYMSTPQENPEGYATGSVMTFADRITGKLLLIHGLLDENVHFRHTTRLMNALNRARVPYEVLLFPDERHGPRRLADRVTQHERTIAFFQRHL